MTPNDAAKVGTEHAHQKAVFIWANMVRMYGFAAAWDEHCYGNKYYCEGQYNKSVGVPSIADMFAIPNGGERHIAVASKLKAEGVKKGVVDIFLPVPRAWSGKFGLWIEMKKPGEKPTTEQNDFMQRMVDNGYASVWADNWADACRAIEAYYGGTR